MLTDINNKNNSNNNNNINNSINVPSSKVSFSIICMNSNSENENGMKQLEHDINDSICYRIFYCTLFFFKKIDSRNEIDSI